MVPISVVFRRRCFPIDCDGMMEKEGNKITMMMMVMAIDGWW